MARTTTIARTSATESKTRAQARTEERARARAKKRSNNRKKNKVERRSWLWRHRRVLFLMWLFVFFGVGGALYLLSRVPLPPAQPQTQTTFIYAADGTQLATINSGENRVNVSLSQVPQVAIDAVVATEDHGFYQHGGIDVVGVFRALVSDIRGNGNLQGGSTITQQYIKQAYLTSQRTLLRKIKEAALAVRLQRTLTKNQILERYLNTIYFGRDAYGIQAASEAYFQESVGQLTLPQAALLAGLIRGPELADPFRYPAIAMGRRSETLASMVKYHKITQAQANAANATPLPTNPPNPSATEAQTLDNYHAQYYLDYVEQQLEAHYQVGLGLRVTTTINLTMQNEAYDAIYGSGGLRYSGDPAGALVAVDNNGNVLAMVGGQSYATSQVNLATGTAGGGSGRQPGSTFKAFLLAEALKEGYSVNSTFPAPPEVDVLGAGPGGTPYPVKNFDNEDGGPSVSLIDATAQSLNTVYVQLEEAIGPAKLLAMAKEFGLDPADVGMSPNASLVLGTAQVSVLEMAAAYSTFARGGVYLEPQVISKVTTANGTVLPLPTAAPTQILDTAQNNVLTYCLEQVVQKGGTGAAANFGTPIAGKTGTTSDFDNAWFIGFTPKLTAAVWMGYRDASKPMMNINGTTGGAEGGGVPATLWRHFMAAVTDNGKNSTYTGTFAPVTSFPGAIIKSPTSILTFPQGMGVPTTTTTTTLPHAVIAPSPTTTLPRRTPTTVPTSVTTTLPPFTGTTEPKPHR